MSNSIPCLSSSNKPAILVLEDGSVFRGTSIGADGISVAEVVFAGAGHAARVVDGDEGREVFVVGTKSVSDP